MNYSIWDNLEKSIEKATVSHENESLTARSTSPLPESPPEHTRSQRAVRGHIEPIFDEERFWQENEAIIESVPVENRIPLKLGLIEEHILSGLRTGADRTALFLAATLGVSIANNDKGFYAEVRKAIEK